MKFLQQNIDITHLSNFKTKAKARYYFEIQTKDDLVKLQAILHFSEENNLKTLFIGAGTNMFFAFDTFKGIVIKNSLEGWNYDSDTKRLNTYSNEYIWEIAETLEKKYNQALWHRFIGLPGSVGGAIFGNAGCFGLETASNLISVQAYDIDKKQIVSFSKKQCDFSYRNSIFKKTGNYFIISGEFDLSKKIEKYHSDVDNIYFREYKQPKGNTCGSFFKNPKIDREVFCKQFPKVCEDTVKNISAGFLIEKSGLKGYKYKTAYMSDLHANFLMSEMQADYQDLLQLIKVVQEKVKEKFHIELEPEVRIITN